MIRKIIVLIVVTFVTISALLADEKINAKQLYNQIGLANIMPYELFEKGIYGYNKIEGKKKPIITFIDFSQASSDERMYVIDVQNKILLYETHVSHGRNSGDNYAISFSNEKGSFKSSLGFFLTSDTYYGQNGYSLKLRGMEEDINDNAEKRYIVVHGAKYSNPSKIKNNGRLGRSLGCPALPQAVSVKIIDTIKNGSVLFIYANNSDYLSRSRYIEANSSEPNNSVNF